MIAGRSCEQFSVKALSHDIAADASTLKGSHGLEREREMKHMRDTGRSFSATFHSIF